ncbi:GNAT family N-acetyltransferase [Lacticaseibacillus daqingensis]|uniref:GNAT family N-acetyltransferase n=1 Tax=Lacticaseibacillus daqingensis TaxID=2486014 RepID=UPI000F7AF4E0|nr:GNAT family N-acetyltransferase [Lacticaseibacillus daqingensis]
MVTYTWARPTVITDDAILALYQSVGWTAYLNDPANTLAALAASPVLWATDGPALIGLIRVVTDHHTIVYVQDLLVAPAHQRQHIGRSLMTQLLAHFAAVGQVVLLTDDAPRTQAFYTALGFTEVTPAAYGRAFVRDTR